MMTPPCRLRFCRGKDKEGCFPNEIGDDPIYEFRREGERLKPLPGLLGYADKKYAYSFQEFGEPRELPRSGGWILVRPIPGTAYKDAMGCYPLFVCHDWTKLHEDLEKAGSDLVSLALVIDPFAAVDLGYLNQKFDTVKPFKTHYIADLNQPLETFIDREVQRRARQSLTKMDVELCFEPKRYLEDWIRLYDYLIRRHHIKGINAFSPQSFEMQLNTPGMVMFLGKRGREILGASLVLKHDPVVYGHLSAYSHEGYQERASYAIKWKALIYAREEGFRYFHLGGGSGIKEDPSDGLASFKRKWSNERGLAYFCGRVFDRGKYESLSRHSGMENIEYFPAYRSGEFGFESPDKIEKEENFRGFVKSRGGL